MLNFIGLLSYKTYNFWSKPEWSIVNPIENDSAIYLLDPCWLRDKANSSTYSGAKYVISFSNSDFV